MALPVGQPLVVSCAGGTLSAVVRVTTTAVLATASTATVDDYGTPFATTADACLTQTGGQAPYVMLMLEYRLRVIDVGGQPWLVAFRNLADDVTTSTNYDPVAAGVENFQVAYVMNRPPATSGCCAAQAAPDASGNSDWVLGDAPSDEALDATAAAPLYSTPYDATAALQPPPGERARHQVHAGHPVVAGRQDEGVEPGRGGQLDAGEHGPRRLLPLLHDHAGAPAQPGLALGLRAGDSPGDRHHRLERLGRLT